MTRYLRSELVLPVTIIAAAIMVGVSEFMTTFEFNSGGEPQAVSLAADRHSYALLILGVFTVAGMLYAVRTGLRAAALGTAALGLASLLLFLILDLPDAGKAGPLGDDPTIYFADARADPQAGFWLEAVGTVVLGLATVAFATLSSTQLRTPAELLGSRRGKRTAEPKRGKSAEREPVEREKRPLREGLAMSRRGGAESKPPSSRAERAADDRPKAAERASEPADPQREARGPRQRPAQDRPPARTAAEERAAARQRLTGSGGKSTPQARTQPKQSGRSLPELLRRLRGNNS